jgi:hypothetical protein
VCVIGRVLDAMGNPMDGEGTLDESIDEWWSTLDQEEPSLIAREPVKVHTHSLPSFIINWSIHRSHWYGMAWIVFGVKEMIHTGFKHLE